MSKDFTIKPKGVHKTNKREVVYIGNIKKRIGAQNTAHITY